MNIFPYLIDLGQDRYTTEIRTDSVERVNMLLALGYSYQLAETGVVLRAPEDWLIDITDVSKANSLSCDFKNVLAFYLTLIDFFAEMGGDNFVKKILSQKAEYAEFDFKISQSLKIWGEVRIIGSDNRVKKVRQDVFDYVIRSDVFLKNYKYIEHNINCRSFREDKLSINTTGYYEKYKSLFTYYEKINGLKFDVIKKIQMDNSLLPDVDCFLFAPKSCFEYMFSFISEDSPVAVSFLEVHAYNVSISMIKCFEEEMQGKKIAIFDKVYSGKTIDILTKYVVDKGGIPISIGVFPKNIEKYSLLDYFVFLDKLIPTQKYDSFMDIIEKVMQ